MQISKEQAIDQLQQWQQDETTLWLYFTAQHGTAGLVMLAEITDVSACLVFRGESAILRFALDRAQFGYGPLQAVLIPSGKGIVAAVSQRRKVGLAQGDGLHIRLESGHSLFIRESRGLEQTALEFPALMLVLLC